MKDGTVLNVTMSKWYNNGCMATLAKEHLKRFSNLDLNQTHYQHYGALEFYSYLKHVKTLQLLMHLLLPQTGGSSS